MKATKRQISDSPDSDIYANLMLNRKRKEYESLNGRTAKDATSRGLLGANERNTGRERRHGFS